MTKTTKKILVQRELVKVDFGVYWTARGVLLKQLFEENKVIGAFFYSPASTA